MLFKKLGYVLQYYLIFTGEHGSVGLTLSNHEANSKEEIVLGLQAGDVIPVPLSAVSWWYNYGNSDVVILFLGETSTTYVPGEFSYFFLTGALGSLGGFSSDFISKSYNISETDAKMLVQSQTGTLLVKLSPEEGQNLPLLTNDNKWVKNIGNILPDINVKKAGIATSFTGVNFPFLEEVGLSCNLVKLEANAMLSPMYNIGSIVQVLYVAKGSGKVQIVGMNGKRALDSNIVAGQLLIVPRFFVFSIIADDEGIDCFSIKTSTRPNVGELAGKQSVLNVLQSTVLKSALNVTPEFANSFKEKMAESEILIPPMN
ncbi:glutelin type-A 3-like [Pistacia vera]|uniref:glutelin type-A 3-like n=1 Tax=Pistacia vera TaxID=55513 RepID=UPI001263B144|nr:glutelin type-A 3-like [Pistacia vera]